MRQRIGVYGGSFDPVHAGHLRVARAALADLALDRLLVVPAAVSPFKTSAAPSSAAQWDRVGSLKAAFRHLDKTVVDEREIRRGGVSYAIDTVREIAAENPDADLYFIVGEDSVDGLPRWKDIDALRRLCVFRAYPRTAESSTEIRRLFADSKVVLNPDAELVRAVRTDHYEKGVLCPCPAFLASLADGSFDGACPCRLYLKGK